jgi:hypothetical protein
MIRPLLGDGRGGAAEIAGFEEGDLEPPSIDGPPRSVAHDAGAVHAAADDEKVEDVVCCHGSVAVAEAGHWCKGGR